MRPSWGQVEAKNEEEGASGGEEQEKKEQQTDLQGFAEFARHLGPFHEKQPSGGATGGHWRESVAGLLGLAFMQGQLGQGLGKNLTENPTQLHPFGGRRIQLRCAPSPPPCLGMFGWSAGGSVGLHASQLVNQRTSEQVNQSTNQLVSQSTNQKSTPKSTTSGPTWAQNRFKIGP